MKNFLKILAAFVLAYIIALFRFVAISAWFWLPMLMDHWLGTVIGAVIGVVILISAEILYYKFIGDN